LRDVPHDVAQRESAGERSRVGAGRSFGAQATREDLVEPAVEDVRPAFCSVDRAAIRLGISRSSAYQLANEWLDSDGKAGLPCVRLRRRILVPTAVIDRWAAVGSGNSG
jgi:hypothetical protein